MKKMKTLALLFLAVIISSTGLTSCIDEDVDPAVAAIYSNQALLLASQANLNNANSTYQLALANLQDAYAAAALSAAADASQAADDASQAADDASVYQLALANLQDAHAAAVLSAADDASQLAAANAVYQIAMASLQDAIAAATISAAADASQAADVDAIYQQALANLEDARAAAILSAADDASLLAAADAAYILAMASLQDAMATSALSAAADASAESAQNILTQVQQDAIAAAAAAQSLSESEAALDHAIALNAIAVEEALMLLDTARLNWELAAITIQASIDDAYVVLATGYFNAYNTARIAAILVEGSAITKQSQIDVAQMLINTSQMPNVSWEYYLAEQQDILTTLQADLAAKEAAITAAESVIADPSTAESKSSELQAIVLENIETLAAKGIEKIELTSAMIPLNEEITGYWTVDGLYHTTIASIDFNNLQIDAYENAINAYEGYIADLDADILSYDADVVAAEDAAATAATAATDAATAATDAVDAQVITADELSDADTVVVDANDDLDDLEVVIDGLVVTLNDAAVLLATEQGIYDAGVGVATLDVTNAGTAVTAAENGVGAATVVYETWRDRFEGGTTTNGGFYWEDTTDPSLELGDDVLGLQTDDTNVAVVTYVLVDDWDTGTVAPDDNVGDSLDGTLEATLPVGGVVYVPGTLLTDADLANAYPIGTTGYYVEVGTDDTFLNNLHEFQDATIALGNEDIMDVPPVLGDPATGDADAYSVLWDAMLDEITAIDFLANFGDARDAAQLAYNDLKEVYENQLTLLVAAQVVVSDAVAAQIPFAEANVLALSEIVTTNLALGLADAALATADGVVNTLLATTPADMQETIEGHEHQIVEANITLGQFNAINDDLLIKLAGYEADVVEAGLTSGVAKAALLVMLNEMDDLDAEINALTAANVQYNLVVTAIASDNEMLQALLDIMTDAIPACYESIEAQEVLIALGVIDEAAAQNAITQLENELAVFEEQILGLNTLADKYWDLMLAALEA